MSNERENPFTKKAEQNAESKGRPGRKPMTPNFEQVVAAVERGEYDETLHELTAAIKTRTVFRQEHVMALVTEVFGSDAVIEFTKSVGDSAQFTRSRMNVGEETVEESSGAPLTEQQNPMRGGGVGDPPVGMHSNDQAEVASVDPPTDPLAHLDAVEQTMEAEARVDPDVTINTASEQVPLSQIPIDQRSSSIGGLSPSDMGDR